MEENETRRKTSQKLLGNGNATDFKPPQHLSSPVIYTTQSRTVCDETVTDASSAPLWVSKPSSGRVQMGLVWHPRAYPSSRTLSSDGGSGDGQEKGGLAQWALSRYFPYLQGKVDLESGEYFDRPENSITLAAPWAKLANWRGQSASGHSVVFACEDDAELWKSLAGTITCVYPFTVLFQIVG